MLDKETDSERVLVSRQQRRRQLASTLLGVPRLNIAHEHGTAGVGAKSCVSPCGLYNIKGKGGGALRGRVPIVCLPAGRLEGHRILRRGGQRIVANNLCGSTPTLLLASSTPKRRTTDESINAVVYAVQWSFIEKCALLKKCAWQHSRDYISIVRFLGGDGGGDGAGWQGKAKGCHCKVCVR